LARTVTAQEVLEIPFQRVKPESGKVECVDPLCFVQNREDLPDPSDMLGTDAPRVVFLEQLT